MSFVDKLCCRCGLSQPHGVRPNGKLHGYCKKCKFETNQEIRQRNRDFITEAKNVPCADCGLRFPHYIMQFDHLKDKKFTIAENMLISLARIQDEVSKCEVVCANCHAARTWNRLHL